MVRIAIGADHGGYEMKERMKQYIAQLGYETMDVGTFSTVRCDYPDYAFMAAQAVSSRKCDVGIMIDAVGIGSFILHGTVSFTTAQICFVWGALL